MRKLTMVLFSVLLAGCLVSGASAYTYSLASHEGLDGEVQVQVFGNGSNEVQLEVSVVGDILGDLRGLFFDYDSDSDIQVTNSSDVTDWADGNLGKLGNMMKGTQQTFDFGAELGTNGMSNDDISSTTLTLSSASAISIGEEFGVRVTSVGTEGNREQSRKYLYVKDSFGSIIEENTPEEIEEVTDPETPVTPPDTTPGGGSDASATPEPGTMLLLGAGLAGLAVLRKKYSKS